MARAVEQIERDIAALEDAVSARRRNQQCLHYLSNRPGANRAAAPDSASYHLCTQGCKTFS